MRKNIFLITIIMFLIAVGVSNAGKEHDMKPITGSAELERVKKLAGTWEGTSTVQGKEHPLSVIYQVTSNGSAVIETMGPGTPHEMVTMYHDDKKKLTMTHYCGLGNQPVMDLKKAKDNKLVFDFSKKKNSINPKKDEHMHSLTITLVDKNTMTHEWSFYKKGKLEFVTEAHLKRK